MLSFNNKLELLDKNQLSEICNNYLINNKIYTYNHLNKLIKTNKICCKYDMIDLLNLFVNSKEKKIIYYDFTNSNKPFNNDTNITFKNINKIRNYIKKYYKNKYNLEFEYDKITYYILKKYWSNDNPISVKKFCDIYHITKINDNNTENKLKQNYNIEIIKKDIINFIDEYIILSN